MGLISGGRSRLIRLLPLFLSALPFTTGAQGLHFEEGLSWAAVRAKAKTDNKYIFVDCYTTWCGPCKRMGTETFPQPEVGAAMNDQFISVSVQLDTTSRDNDYVKGWYADAHELITDYHVYAYPTFLIFSPDGKPLGRIVGGYKPEPFLAAVRESLDPKQQYYTRLQEFRDGNRDPAFLRRLAIQAHRVYDRETGQEVMRALIDGSEDVFTKDPLDVLLTYTERSSDSTFPFLIANAAKIDTVMGVGVAEQPITKILLTEYVLPQIMNAGRQEPSWESIHRVIAMQYPEWADEMTQRGKIFYYQRKGDWPNFQKAIIPFMEQYGAHTSGIELNDFAREVFRRDMSCVSMALDWSKRAMDLYPKAPFFMDTYANILYKMGKKDEALVWEQKAIDAATPQARYQYENMLAKMQKDEKTWN